MPTEERNIIIIDMMSVNVTNMSTSTNDVTKF